MKKLVESPCLLEYFSFCEGIGCEAVDAGVKSRFMVLRWTRAVSDGYGVLEGIRFEKL